MSRNHYVSKFKIKRFSDMKDKINIFDTKGKFILKDRVSKQIFCKENMYSEEIERKLNVNLENPMAKLVDEKILGKDTIIINRKELLLIKKFLLLDSIRTLNAEGFLTIMTGFTDAVNRYIELQDVNDIKMIKSLPSISDSKDSAENLFEKALRVFIDSDDIQDILNHSDANRELYIWSKVLSDGYIAFWDSNDEQEFIITDNGMTSEYEPSHMLYGGLDHSKLSYLLHKINDKNIKKEETLIYCSLLNKLSIMYENFSLFSLSSKRCIVSINPFFRLYSYEGFKNYDKDGNLEIIKPFKPDVWPSFMGSRFAFETPKNEYKIKGKCDLEDIFEYNPYKLSLFDTVYINNLFLNQKVNLIGFLSFDKIKDTFYSLIAMNVANKKKLFFDSNTKPDFKEILPKLINDEFFYIFEHYKNEDSNPRFNPIDFLNHYVEMCMNDTRGNIYALEYLLLGEDKVRTMCNFDFMGSPDERIQIIKDDIARIKNSESIIDLIKRQQNEENALSEKYNRYKDKEDELIELYRDPVMQNCINLLQEVKGEHNLELIKKVSEMQKTSFEYEKMTIVSNELFFLKLQYFKELSMFIEMIEKDRNKLFSQEYTKRIDELSDLGHFLYHLLSPEYELEDLKSGAFEKVIADNFEKNIDVYYKNIINEDINSTNNLQSMKSSIIREAIRFFKNMSYDNCISQLTKLIVRELEVTSDEEQYPDFRDKSLLEKVYITENEYFIKSYIKIEKYYNKITDFNNWNRNDLNIIAIMQGISDRVTTKIDCVKVFNLFNSLSFILYFVRRILEQKQFSLTFANLYKNIYNI